MIFSSLGDMNGGNNRECEEMKETMELYDYQQQLSLHHQKRECMSDEVDSKSSGELKKQKQRTGKKSSEGGGDGASIEVIRRPRGRPPGSKNKPKPPVIITQEAEPSSSMRPHVLEIPGGHDVADSLARFSRRRNLGICVLAGTGSVANVTLRQPTGMGGPHADPEGSTIGFRGRFEILSISATFLPPSLAALSPGSAVSSLSISLAGPQGRIVGGTVAGPLMAAGTVVVVAAAFSNPSFHRLPAEDDVSVSVSGGDVEAAGHPEHDHDHDPHPHHSQHHQQQHPHPHHLLSPPSVHPVAPAESCGMSIYSCHLPSDVIWAPTARPPPY